MSRQSGTLQRLERILTMVPWLLDNAGAGIQEVADRFGATREEMAEDLDVLGYCGLPGYGGGDLVEVSIVGDRVVVRMADFFRRPLALNLREAMTLLLAARALSGVSVLPESGALRRAEGKLTALLAAAAVGVGADGPASPGLAIDLTAPGDDLLPALRRAVDDRTVVRITYRAGSTGEVTEREVEPWGLTGGGGSWYLTGYCRRAAARRDFRLDRIRDLEVTDEVAGTTDSAQPGAPPSYRPGPDDERVVLDLQRSAWWVAEWAVVDDVRDLGDTRRVTLRTARRSWAARLVLALGDGVTVVEPSDLTLSVQTLARSVLDRYRPGGGT